jgi:hypothetical protein
MEDNLGPWLSGFVTGFIFAGIIGFVSGRILWLWGRVGAIWSPQTIPLTTKQTPWDILVRGCMSLFALIILITLILVGIFLFATVSISG